MKFSVKIKTVSSHPKTGVDALSVFFLENKGKKTEFKSIEELFNLKFNSSSNKLLTDEDTSKVEIQTEDKGNILIFKFKKAELTVDYFRDSLAGCLQSLNSAAAKELAVSIPEYCDFSELFDSEEYFSQSFIEGVLLGNYDFSVYKSKKKRTPKLNAVFVGSNLKLLKSAAVKAEKTIEAVCFAKDLVNEPAITLTPREFVRRVKKNFTDTSVKVKTMNEAALKRNKMNAILSVGRGSDNPPILLVLEYKPARAKETIALVGKGITYDSGGLSIKPTDGMLEMKGDMAGAAAVVGTFFAADKLKIGKALIGVIPLAENLINGSSYKPGDIVSTASGKTIEVKNTDAEGRIVLADALEYACKFKPNAVIDFATLTGACVVALGEFAAGMFTKDRTLAGKLKRAGDKTYEILWELPFMDAYKKLLKSDIADISNIGSRWGGAITAAKFLENFMEKDIPYVHLDIAGPALKHELTSYTKKWATGFGVRLMSDFLSE